MVTNPYPSQKFTQKNSETIGNPKGTQWFLGKNPREPKRNLMLRPKKIKPNLNGQEMSEGARLVVESSVDAFRKAMAMDYYITKYQGKMTQALHHSLRLS